MLFSIHILDMIQILNCMFLWLILQFYTGQPHVSLWNHGDWKKTAIRGLPKPQYLSIRLLLTCLFLVSYLQFTISLSFSLTSRFSFSLLLWQNTIITLTNVQSSRYVKMSIDKPISYGFQYSKEFNQVLKKSLARRAEWTAPIPSPRPASSRTL